ncbi:MAG TPA: VWA domain-containing protein, partial [Polyangiaceae bacterium]
MGAPNTTADHGSSGAFNSAASQSAASNSSAVPSGGGTSATSGAPGGGNGCVPAGVLTAGVWDDNRNYDFFDAYLATNAQLDGIPPIARADRAQAHSLFAVNQPARSRLDIAIVIDTTGSMQDEATYLSAEFQNISAAIAAKFPNADQHWGLVAYRDRSDTDPGDEYVVRSWDFTTDLASYQRTIGALTANNGGDYPEAPDIGLATANGLSWRTDAAVARLAFWVADAPQHDQYAGAMAKDFSDARAKGIHLYPVSA